MKSFLGMSLKSAKQACKVSDKAMDVIHYSAKNGVEHADTDIVIRQRQMNDKLELVVSAFKTKLND